jgi:hypothetical protein
MKNLSLSIIALLLLSACHESLEDRAEREAREYTEKFCPTPVVNYQRTDSTVFDKSTRTYICYCSFTDKLDDAALISRAKADIHKGLLQSIRNNTPLKNYKEAGFNFSYIIYSTKERNKVLYQDKFSPKDYK